MPVAYGEQGQLEVPTDAPAGTHAAQGEEDKNRKYIGLDHPWRFIPAVYEEFGRPRHQLDEFLHDLARHRAAHDLGTLPCDLDTHPDLGRTLRSRALCLLLYPKVGFPLQRERFDSL